MLRIRFAISVTGLALLAATNVSVACPFCVAESQTLTEEIDTANAVVLAKLLKPALPPSQVPDGLGGFGAADPETGKATFEIVEILKGKEHLIGIEEVQAIFFDTPDPKKVYLIRGLGDPLEWTIPFALSETGVDYVKKLLTLPKEGPERMRFFMDYLEHEDSMLGQDAYDEFAGAPYEDVQALKGDMDREQLLEWIESPHVSPSRRRLFLTMLGVCGQPEDMKRLEEMILSNGEVLFPAVEAMASVSLSSDGPISAVLLPEMIRAEERRRKLGLDALVGCYVVLGGPEKMDVIDARFLEGDQSEISHTFTVLMALRILTDGMEILPPDRAAQSARLLLGNRDFADQVIPDLARWEDWSVLDRLVDMFKRAQKQSYIREPVVTYLDIAAEQSGEIGEKAREALEECEVIDPDSVERARSLAAFGMLARARGNDPAEAPDSATRPPAEAVADEDTGSAEIIEEVTSDKVPASEIPDPAESAEPSFANVETLDDDAIVSDEVAVDNPEVVAQESTPEEIISPTTAPPIRQNVAKPTMEPFEEPSRLWIVGLPVLGAAVFMGLFWIILRSGAG